MAQSTPSSRRRLGIGLTVAMVVTMLMGPGPGLWLINPDPADPNARFLLAGIPVVYLWGVLWFIAQVVIILAANRMIWRHDDAEADLTTREA